ncbi:LCP family protein [Gulosibacter sp. 10]|uniref:LCP family glycopolymer transferase n=1 Tax=Gulosibacter sp. 10 TaxID=1255570 RepID=UPI00097E805E|nr:LCP family protein [Gulosibacter sp. 10]SJM48135.1 Cell envelope-related transcriptional attenuator [Gulosibacter sp. 10]
MNESKPLRHPDASSPEFMTKRAWWLVVANLLVPGAGPLLAGNRRFGRLGLRLWMLAILAIIIVVLLWFLLRGPLLFMLTTAWGLRILAAILLGYGLWMMATMLETLRQVKLFRVDAFARGLIAVVAIVLAVVPVFVGGYGAANVMQAQGAVQQLFGGPNGGLKFPSDGRLNVLMLGGDAGDTRDGMRPDSVSVMSFDVFSGQTTSVGLPRNLMHFGFSEGPMQEMYPEDYTYCNVDPCYLNSVYTEVTYHDYDIYPEAEDKGSDKGIEATRDAVEWITGLEIHYYVFINMDGFADLVDAMGGVTIDVKEPIALGANDEGQEGWKPPTEWIEPGVQVLDGHHAQWYARSRYESTDYDRMQRQRELQDAIISQLPKAMLGHSGPILSVLDEVIQTDIPKGEAGVIADLALKGRGREDNIRVQLSPPYIDPEAPDYAYAQQLIQNAMDGEAPPETE